MHSGNDSPQSRSLRVSRCPAIPEAEQMFSSWQRALATLSALTTSGSTDVCSGIELSFRSSPPLSKTRHAGRYELEQTVSDRLVGHRDDE